MHVKKIQRKKQNAKLKISPTIFFCSFVSRSIGFSLCFVNFCQRRQLKPKRSERKNEMKNDYFLWAQSTLIDRLKKHLINSKEIYCWSVNAGVVLSHLRSCRRLWDKLIALAEGSFLLGRNKQIKFFFLFLSLSLTLSRFSISIKF